MAKMHNRINTLENQVAGCVENLEVFSIQLTVMQDFLQKQFGSRFVDYASNRGVYFEKPIPATSNRLLPNPYCSSTKTGSTFTTATTSQSYEREVSVEYANEVQDTSDPLAFVEIIDDSDGYQYNQFGEYEAGEEYEYEGEEGYYGVKNEQADGNEEYYEEDATDYGNGIDEDHDNSGLVIVNCISEKAIKKEMTPAIRLPSPPPITARPPPARTYVKSISVANPKTPGAETHKLRLPSNFLGGRKRPAASTSLGESNSSPLAKMPYLHPQVIATPQQISNTDSQQDEYDDLLGPYAASIDDGATLDGMLDMKLERVDPECNEDLREYYDVLPDKSVQCKICDKVLKAGWHKYGRHYRTHTGEKPFSCAQCGEKFARKDNMNNHIKSKHEQKRQRPSSNENISSTDEFSPMYYLSSELC